MKINIRKSSIKNKRKMGFLARMKTKGGRAILKNQRKRKHNMK